MVQAPPKPKEPPEAWQGINIPPIREYNRRGGRPGLQVEFRAVYNAVQAARKGNGETMSDIASRFGVSRAWIWKWIYPALDDMPTAQPSTAQ